MQQWATFGRVWHIFDCKFQNPFDSAKVIVSYLKGMQKPIYHPLSKLYENLTNVSKLLITQIIYILLDDCGDHVVCINTKHIALPGDEWTKRGTESHMHLLVKSNKCFLF